MKIGLLFLMNSAHAEGGEPNLHMKISGDIKKTYYLCVSNAGCVNLAAGVQGKKFPMNPGDINYIFITNAANVRMYPQPLPASCQVELNENQTLVVSGKVATKAANDDIYIEKLHCSVA
jgi:hypothetical protein